MQSIYVESQRGGLCRLHSINAYFGKPVISESQFNTYMDEYNKEYQTRYNNIPKCQEFDCVSSDQKTCVSFILKKHNIYTRYYALNELVGKDIHTNIVQILVGDFFFIFNENHIWGIRRVDGRWYTVDSLSGVHPLDINSLCWQKNYGFIVPVNIKSEFYHNLMMIKNIFDPSPTKQHIIDYLIQKHKEKKILDQLEIPLGICVSILETNLSGKSPVEFAAIELIVLQYNGFMALFTNKRYMDIELILEYIPDILVWLLGLRGGRD